jgi:hypothetical protein
MFQLCSLKLAYHQRLFAGADRISGDVDMVMVPVNYASGRPAMGPLLIPAPDARSFEKGGFAPACLCVVQFQDSPAIRPATNR